MCWESFDATFNKKQMDRVRAFTENFKPKTEKVYTPVYSLQFCEDCASKLNERIEEIYGHYKLWPNVMLGFLPGKSDVKRPTMFVQKSRPYLGPKTSDATQTARGEIVLTRNPQE
jgi:hypothetical protein